MGNEGGGALRGDGGLFANKDTSSTDSQWPLLAEAGTSPKKATISGSPASGLGGWGERVGIGSRRREQSIGSTLLQKGCNLTET